MFVRDAQTMGYLMLIYGDLLVKRQLLGSPLYHIIDTSAKALLGFTVGKWWFGGSVSLNEKSIMKLNAFHRKHAEYSLTSQFLITPIAIGGACIASRLAAGGMGMIAKSSSWFAKKYGQDDLAEKIDQTKDKLFAFAARSPKIDLQITIGSTFLSTMGIGLSILSKGFPEWDSSIPWMFTAWEAD